jgi:hypothetical protein
MAIAAHSIKFGTDGWRGVIAADFTFERLALVAPAAAKVLADVYGDTTGVTQLLWDTTGASWRKNLPKRQLRWSKPLGLM